MGIFDAFEVGTIAVNETAMLEIKATICMILCTRDDFPGKFLTSSDDY